jgi:hypothetical protein
MLAMRRKEPFTANGTRQAFAELHRNAGNGPRFFVCFNDMLHLQSDNVMSRQQDAARTPNVLRENAASRAYNATNLLNYEPGRVR